MAPPPPRKIRSTLEPVGRRVFEDVPGAAGRRLVDGAEDVAGTVRQRQPDDRAPGLRVLVGRAVPLPVVADDQALAPGGDCGGLLVEHLEDVNAPRARPRCSLVAGEVAAVPVEDRARWPSGRPRACRAPRPSRRDSSRPPRSRRRPRATGPGGRCSSRRSPPRRRPGSHPGRASPGRRRSRPGRPGSPPAGPDRRPRPAQAGLRLCPAARSAAAISRAGRPARPPQQARRGQPPSGRA